MQVVLDCNAADKKYHELNIEQHAQVEDLQPVYKQTKIHLSVRK